jgi:hypothetical protein
MTMTYQHEGVMEEIKKQIVAWKAAQDAYVSAREAYRTAWAKEFLLSDAKNEAGKKAFADSQTSDLRLARDNSETAAAAEWQLLIAMRGAIEASRQPGQHFG